MRYHVGEAFHLLKRRRKLVSIRADEIDYNLISLFGNPDSETAGRALTGYNILIDEITLDKRAHYGPTK